METSSEKRFSPGILKETILIVVSVALGYIAAQYASSREEERLALQAINGIRKEIASNLAVLEPLVPVHEKWTQKLNGRDPEGRSGIDVFFSTRPPLPTSNQSPFAFLQRNAWDAAIAGGALRYLDFELVSALSNMYTAQEITTQNVRRLAEGALVEVDIYDPAKGVPSVRLLWLTLADIESAEKRLIDLYKKQLDLLDTRED